MQLSEISNQGFRNLSSDPVFFGAGVTLITGENAQGKTNLLEATALVCGQRSFRGAASSAMARDGEAFAITGVFSNPARSSASERLTVSWSKSEGRQFRRGEKPAGFRDVSAIAPAVFLAPEHRELLLGAPSARRRFLDRLVLGLKPAAGDDLGRYATALRERNALLARSRRGGGVEAPGELEAWTEELAVAGSAVRRHRRAALGLWNAEFEPLAREAGDAYRGVRAEYSASGDSAEEIRAACQKLLSLERRRGYSLAGPHRDDLVWTRDGRPLADEASSGEVARTVALVKLAEWSAVARAAGEPPLFAADDFDAGLSEGWVEEFFEALPAEAQVLLTTAAPQARYTSSGRSVAVVEMRRGSAVSTPILRAVVVRQDADVVRQDADVVRQDADVVRQDARIMEA